MTPGSGLLTVGGLDPLALAVAAATGVGVLLLLLGLGAVARRQRVVGRLARFAGSPAAADEPSARTSLRPRTLALAWLEWLGRLLNRILGAPRRAALAARFQRAGEPWGLTANQMSGLRVVSAALGILAIVAVPRLAPGPLGLAAAVILGALGILGPDAWLGREVATRRRAVERELPQVVDLLALALGAGLSFDAAVNTISARMDGPLAAELRRYLRAVGDMGLSRAEALATMARRVDSEELLQFANAVHRSMEQGAGLLAAITSQARLLRQVRRRQAEAAAQQAPIRMMLPMTLFILPVLMLIVIGPVVLRFYITATGGRT